ncbi:MAG: NAD(P)-dependent oxidoreductase [Acidimicrobiales bacterium]
MIAGDLLLAGTEAIRFRHHLDTYLTTRWRIHQWDTTDPVPELDRLMARSSAVVVGPDAVRARQVVPQLKVNNTLQLVQVPFAGTDFFDPAWLPAGCVVANSTGHESAIAEFVLATMLEWVIGRRAIEDDFRSGSWQYLGSRPNALVHGELRGRTLGLVGWGGIAREVATRAEAFAMDLVAIGRSDRALEPPLRWYGTGPDIDRLMGESDIVVVACDLNDRTRGMIGADQLDRLGPAGVIVNIARGPVIDEDDLYAALVERRIAGAVIDVWYGYPDPADPDRPPSRHPFSELDNVILSPHCSGRTAEALERRWRTVAENLDHLARREPIPTKVLEGTRPRTS